MPIGAPDEKKEGFTININGWVAVIVLFVGYVGYNEYNKFTSNTPSPGPVPVVPAPGQKTLGDLVEPSKSTDLANLYHGMAVMLYHDKGRVEKPDEDPVIKTIGDFYEMHQHAMQAFQQTTKIAGISAINDPISNKLKVATGTLAPSKKLDDPAAPVRDSLIATCQQIAQEFDARYLNISLNQF